MQGTPKEGAPSGGTSGDAPKVSPEITHTDLTDKTKDEAIQFAKDKRLVQNPDYPPKWMDPVTGKERLRINDAHVVEPTGKLYKGTAGVPHLHGSLPGGPKEGKIMNPETGDLHFPLKQNK